MSGLSCQLLHSSQYCVLTLHHIRFQPESSFQGTRTDFSRRCPGHSLVNKWFRRICRTLVVATRKACSNCVCGEGLHVVTLFQAVQHRLLEEGRPDSSKTNHCFLFVSVKGVTPVPCNYIYRTNNLEAYSNYRMLLERIGKHSFRPDKCRSFWQILRESLRDGLQKNSQHNHTFRVVFQSRP